AGVAVVDVPAVGERDLGEQRATVGEGGLAADGVGDRAEVGAVVGKDDALVVTVFERGQLALAVEGVGELVVAEELVGGADEREGGERAGGADEAAVRLFGVVDVLPVLGVDDDVEVLLYRGGSRAAVVPG